MSKEQLEENEALIRCRVGLGMFSNERSIVAELPDDRFLSSTVDKKHVVVEKDPVPGSGREGFVRVSIVRLEGESTVIDLPQPGITTGSRFSVLTEILHETLPEN